MFAFVNLASSDKLNEKVAFAPQDTTDVEMPQSVTGIDANQQFNVSVNSIPFDKLKGKPGFGQPDIMGVEMDQGVDKLSWVGFEFTVS